MCNQPTDPCWSQSKQCSQPTQPCWKSSNRIYEELFSWGIGVLFQDDVGCSWEDIFHFETSQSWPWRGYQRSTIEFASRIWLRIKETFDLFANSQKSPPLAKNEIYPREWFTVANKTNYRERKNRQHRRSHKIWKPQKSNIATRTADGTCVGGCQTWLHHPISYR